MEALATATEMPVGLPPLSPMQTVLMEAMSKKNVTERSVASVMSMDVGSLRTHVTKLARALELPKRDSHDKEFSQLARQAARLAEAQATAAENIRKKLKLNGVGDNVIAQWQEQLVKVAMAVARGVLVSVDPYKIRPMPGQPRDYFPTEEQDSLDESLGLMGQIQDIIIRRKLPTKGAHTDRPVAETEERVWNFGDTEYEICDGERRWRGAMKKGLLEIRAKLIDIDDQGAYLVAGVSNLNRVGHTTLEKARHIKRLMEGETPFPIEIAAAMQGISVQTANKLLDALKLPPDILALMDPKVQRERGQILLGKMPTYVVARLANNPVHHEHARHLARRYVRGEIKMPQMSEEVDRVLSRSGGSRDLIGERQQPARRLKFAQGRLSLAIDYLREAKGRLEDLVEENAMPPGSSKSIAGEIEALSELSTAILEVIGEAPKKAK